MSITAVLESHYGGIRKITVGKSLSIIRLSKYIVNKKKQ
jgi:hypothetical protein